MHLLLHPVHLNKYELNWYQLLGYYIKINFLYQNEAARIILKLINKKGIINLGGNSNSVYDFAKRTNPNVKKIYLRHKKYPKNLTMHTGKLKKLVKI